MVKRATPLVVLGVVAAIGLAACSSKTETVATAPPPPPPPSYAPAPPPEAYIATSGGIFRDLNIHDFDAIRFVTGEEIVEVYADGAVRETQWFARHDDVDAAVAVLRLSGGALGIVSGARQDPLGYDVRERRQEEE